MLKFEIVYKFCLICMLILGLCLLAFSGVNFALGAGTDVAGGELLCLVYGLDHRRRHGLVEVPLAHYRVCPAVAEDVDYPLRVAFAVDLDEHDKGLFGVVVSLV